MDIWKYLNCMNSLQHTFFIPDLSKIYGHFKFHKTPKLKRLKLHMGIRML